MAQNILRKAVEVAGGQTALARQIGKTQGHISKWLQRDFIPPEAVLAIERATGISRHALRPDLYPSLITEFRTHDSAMTTQGAEGLPRRRFTIAEVEAMTAAGILLEDERFEMIEGELVPMNAKGLRHEVYKGSLLTFYMTNKMQGYQIIPETTFRFSADSYFEPDILFYDSRFKLAELSSATALLAIEIADTTLRFDMGQKASIYSQRGVKALWVIDVTSLDTHVFGTPDADGYQSKRIVKDDEILVPDFAPELALKLKDLTLI
jgi:Uma2 family endonuclease